MLTTGHRRERLLLCAILAGGLGIRLIAIAQPYVDAWSWRQADVAMIAENFYRRGFALFYPQINRGLVIIHQAAFKKGLRPTRRSWLCSKRCCHASW